MTDFDVLADGLYFPEGPIACDDGSVVVGEIVGRRLTKIAPDGTKATLAEIDGGPNGLAVGPDNAIYICDNGGLSARLVDGKVVPGDPHAPRPLGSVKRLDLSNGDVTTLFTECDGLPLAGPNDIVFAADGSFWFTALGRETEGIMKLGGLYHAQPDCSSITCIAHGISLNGVGLSPDGSTVYAGATYQRWIVSFSADPTVPAPRGVGWIGNLVTSFPGRCLPDSLAIEADGTIAQGCVVSEPGIYRVDPITGEHVARIEYGDNFVTNIAFGGADMRTAYITLSETGRLIRTRWDAPGLRLHYNLDSI